jgi:urease accessory protein
MASYRNELSVAKHGVPVIRDALTLDPTHGSIARRMDRYDALATVVLVGPAFASARTRIAAELAERPARALESCSVRQDLMLVRLASENAERALARLRELLAEVSALAGDVIARKR